MNNYKKRILAASYLAVWIFAVVIFWCFAGDSDAMGYGLIFIWGVIPITTIALSVIIGHRDYWGKGKWVSPIAFGLMYMLLEYETYSLANNIACNKINSPEWSMILYGAAFSVFGILIGIVIRKIKSD